MIKNILVYLGILTGAFAFNIFYYAWFSWFLLVLAICIPFLSLIVSLPFMISSAANSFIVFSHKSININDEFYIGVTAKKRRTIFCPLLKINLKAENIFADQHDKIKITYGGTLMKPVYKKFNKLSSHCGSVELSAKYCKVYDFMGIFFIPVKINCNFNCVIMPKSKKPELLPDCDKISVVGYKPKSGGGFSDFYELRQYQSGDRLKNIHWKLSSKYDDLIVREPTQPVYKQFAVKIALNSNSGDNDSILARLMYVCRYFNKNGSLCYILSDIDGSVSSVGNDSELKMYFKSLYTNTPYNPCTIDRANTLIYSIFADCEGVNEE